MQNYCENIKAGDTLQIQLVFSSGATTKTWTLDVAVTSFEAEIPVDNIQTATFVFTPLSGITVTP